MECQGTSNRVARFEKVRFELFQSAVISARIHLLTYGDKDISSPSDAMSSLINLKLPERSTSKSAGYDFYSPFDFTLESGKSFVVPTGVCCDINEGWVLIVAPRSGLGFKYRVSLDNTVGVIDGDYFGAENNQIFLKLHNGSDKTIRISKGDRFAQGLFLPYGLTVDDKCLRTREGGLGSTGV